MLRVAIWQALKGAHLVVCNLESRSGSSARRSGVLRGRGWWSEGLINPGLEFLEGELRVCRFGVSFLERCDVV